jgi:Phage integrase family
MQNVPWNKGRLTGQKRPLKPKDVWAIRVRLQLGHRARDLALFNLAIDSKLRGCDLVRLQVDDVCAGGRVRDRATVVQKKTGRPVQFEITEQTRASIRDWLPEVDARNGQYLFPSRLRALPHLSTRQYARIVHTWVESAGLESSAYGTHSMRRTKAAQIYKKTVTSEPSNCSLGTRNSQCPARSCGQAVATSLYSAERAHRSCRRPRRRRLFYRIGGSRGQAAGAARAARDRRILRRNGLADGPAAPSRRSGFELLPTAGAPKGRLR